MSDARSRRTPIAPTLLLLAAALLLATSCSHKPDPNTLVMIIESSPTNLDPRVGIDAQSERIDELLFDSLVRRDEHFQLQPWLADSWEIPDPLTYIFHLHHGVRFHNGQPLTARDVKWTFDSLLNGKLRTSKTSTFTAVDHIDAPDDYTVIFHLKEPMASLLWNVSDGAIGIVPYGSGEDFNRNPIGSGPFRFVSAQQDKNVVIERNPDYWATPAKLERVEFRVIPDATTRALELRKRSADVVSNALTPDMVLTLQKDEGLEVLRGPGTIYAYLALNLRDPTLKDVRVRRALAYSIDLAPIIHYLWRDEARPAYSVLPPQHWAYDADVARYPYDPALARKLLDEAGYPENNGVRFHLAMKTSTEESTRLLAAVFSSSCARSESRSTFTASSSLPSSPTSPRVHTSFIRCAGWAAISIPTSSSTCSRPRASRPSVPIEPSTPIPRWMSLSKSRTPRSTSSSARCCSIRSSRSSPRTCPTSTSGTTTTSSCTPSGCTASS